MQLLKRLFSLVPQKEWLSCVFIFLTMLLGAVVEALGVGLIFPLISLMGTPDYIQHHPQLEAVFAVCGIVDHKTLVIVATTFLLIIYTVKNIYMAWSIHFPISFSVKNQIIFSKELLRVYLYKPYIFYVNHNTASLIRNMTTGAQTVFNEMLVHAFQLLTEILTVVAIWCMLVFVDFFTAIAVVVFFVIVVFAIMDISKKRIAEQGAIVNEFSVQSIKWVNQAFGALKETKLMHKESFFAESYDKAYGEMSRAKGEFDFINQLPRLVIEVVIVSTLLLLIIVRIFLGYAMSDIVPLLSVLALAAFRLMPSANRIVGYANALKLQGPFFNEIYPDFLKIRDVIDKKELLWTEALGMETQALPFNRTIEIRNISFSYPNMEKRVLREVSFDIPKGAFVGIIGPSGAGKTTFVDIFLGLLSPTKGGVYVDGRDISTNLLGWQKLLSYVPQDIYLLDGTIMENIALGYAPEEISEERIERVLHMVDLHEFVSGLSKGIYTDVGERGIRLSGGQKQRIGLARALYQKPEILVLDEATSALDNETEKNIMDTILKLKGEITILSIAHRVSTLEACDFKVDFLGGTASVYSS